MNCPIQPQFGEEKDETNKSQADCQGRLADYTLGRGEERTAENTHTQKPKMGQKMFGERERRGNVLQRR